MTTKNFITSDGINLIYDDQGEGQPVLLLTGYAGCKEIWNSQVKFLVKQGYRVINLDRRNHGQSGVSKKGLRISRHGKDVAELIDRLDLNDIIMIGNSMGASVIWAYCSLFGDEKISKIIDVDQSPKMLSDDSWNYGILDFNWNNFYFKLDDIYNTHTTYRHIDDDTFSLVKSVQHPFDHKLNRPLLLDHVVQDWRDVIRGIDVPSLFVSSDHTPFWNNEYVIKLAELAKKGTYKIIKNAGHIIMAEQSDEFNKIMLDFLISNM